MQFSIPTKPTQSVNGQALQDSPPSEPTVSPAEARAAVDADVDSVPAPTQADLPADDDAVYEEIVEVLSEQDHRDMERFESLRQPWAKHAQELAEWTMTYLVNRIDVWGQYRERDDRGEKGKNNALTKPDIEDRGRFFLENYHLKAHYAGRKVSDVKGLHSTSEDETCRWAAWDIDYHDDDPNPPDPAVNLQHALELYQYLFGLGLHPLLTESNGNGGYHVRIVFTHPIAAADTYAFAQGVAARIKGKIETFPKQKALSGKTVLGNWLRLPGRHHTREHFSTVWSGDKWLAGEDAIEAILATKGDDPHIVIEQAAKFATSHPTSTSAPASAPVIANGEMAAWLRQILDRLPAAKLDDYESWLRVGLAIRHELPGEDGLALWDEISRKSSKYESDACRSRWDSFSDTTDSPVTVGTLFLWIQEQNPDYQPPRKPKANKSTDKPDEPIEILTWAERLKRNPDPQYLPEVIRGLLREQEIITFVSGTKIGKSWVAMQLALCIAAGSRWFGMIVAQGRVLLVDCELHEQTTDVRLKKLAAAMHINVPKAAPNLTVVNLRSRGWDLRKVWSDIIEKYPPGHFKLIILDCLYRLLPDGVSELDDKEIRRIYKDVNRVGAKTQAAIFVVHHTGKGQQLNKKTVDVGNGPSAEARGGDVHCTMIATDEKSEDVKEVFFRAAVRSFPPFKQLTLRKTVSEGATFWQVANPEDQGSTACPRGADLLEAMGFANFCARPEAENKEHIIGRYKHFKDDGGTSISKSRANFLFQEALSAGHIKLAPGPDGRTRLYRRNVTPAEAIAKAQNEVLLDAAQEQSGTEPASPS